MESSRTRWDGVTLLGVALLVGLVMALPLFRGDPSFFYFDDFFYYLVPAKSFLATGTFAFFPSMPTNGFQPLWMVVVLALLGVSHHHDLLFYALMNGTIALLIVWTCWLAMAVVRDATKSPLWSAAAAMWVGALELAIATTGMEVALTLPLLLLVSRMAFACPLGERTPRELVALSALGSLALLSRLDAGLLLLPTAIVLLWADRPSKSALAWLLAGTFPLWIYAALAWAGGSGLMPVSGEAKLLRGPSWPSLAPLAPAILTKPVLAMLLVVALGLLVRARGRDRALFLAALVGTGLYYVTYCTLTDWGLWWWYEYPLGWLVVLACRRLSGRQARMPAIPVAVVGGVLLLFMSYGLVRRTPRTNWIYQHALAVVDFAHTHPGRYAMGDCAGTVAHLGVPVLQVEGLAGDRTLVDAIRQRTPLRSFLSRYRIDYYATVGAERVGQCLVLREPSQAGPASPVMTGHVCSAPLMHRDGPRSLDVFRASDVEP